MGPPGLDASVEDLEYVFPSLSATDIGAVTGYGTEDEFAFFSPGRTAITSASTLKRETAAGGITVIVHRAFRAIGAALDSQIISEAYGAVEPTWHSRRSRGSEALPTAVLSGDALLRLLAAGHDGTAIDQTGARIRVLTTENWGAAAHGTKIAFDTTPALSTTVTERVVIEDSGEVTLNTGPARQLSLNNASAGRSSFVDPAHAANLDYTLPSAQSVASFLHNSGVGVLSWVADTADTFAQYLLLAGRAGAANDAVLSTSIDGTFSGSSASAKSLILQSTTHATKAQVQVKDELRLYTSQAAIATLLQVGYASRVDAAFTVSGAFATFVALGVTGTMTYSGGAAAYLFAAGPGSGADGLILDATSGTALPTFRALINSIQFRANGASLTSGTSETILDNPTFLSPIAAGAMSGIIHRGLSSACLINASVTLAQRNVVDVADATGSGTLTIQRAIKIADLTKGGTNISLESAGTAVQMRHAGPTMFGINAAPTLTNGNIIEVERVHTLAAGVADGQAAGLVLDPGYTGAFTVTRHNYVKYEDVSVAASAVVTDACVMWFDAAAGTHKAVSAHTGAGTPTLGAASAPVTGDPDAWVKINVNGTVMRFPAWA